MFRFYDSSESAYYMVDYPSLRDSDEYVKRISLKGGEWVEIEWLGSEWVHSPDGSHSRYDKIRVEKFTPIVDSPLWDVCVDTTVGWIPEGSLDWNGSSQRGVKIIPVKDPGEYSPDKGRIFVGGVDPDGTDEVVMGGDLN